jgi:hypothetical protein
VRREAGLGNARYSLEIAINCLEFCPIEQQTLDHPTGSCEVSEDFNSFQFPSTCNDRRFSDLLIIQSTM